MIKYYPIIKPTQLLGNIETPDGEPPPNIYNHMAVEDNEWCFQELKRIVQGTKAEVYVNEFNIYCKFCDD